MRQRTLVHLVQGGHTLDVAVSRWYKRAFIRLDGEERVSFRLLPGTITHTLRVPKTGFHEDEGEEDVYEVVVVLDTSLLRKCCLVTVRKNGQVLHSMPTKVTSTDRYGGYEGDVEETAHAKQWRMTVAKLLVCALLVILFLLWLV